MDALITIDGSTGEGGGQVLRSSLALSLATGRSFRIEHIRAGRRKPGLLRQHLTSIKAAAAIGAAEVEGAVLGASTLTFRPQACLPGSYHVQVGSAGSTSLVVQAVVPALLYADGPSEIVVEGGTHAKFAPPFEFLRDAWLPLLNKLGAHVEADLERHGFFPAGGGRIRVRITPTAKPKPLHLLERGRRIDVEARAVVSKVQPSIGHRELKIVGEKLGWQRKHLRVAEVTDAICPGNVLLLKIAHEHVAEVFTAFGAVGVPAEEVGRHACRDAQRYLASKAPIGRFLADQMMLPLALGAGGSYRTGPLSRHAQTNIEIIRQFVDVPLDVEPIGEGSGAERLVEVRIGGRLTPES